MAEATVTLKLTPREFDLVREAVKFDRDNAKHVAYDSSTDMKIRNKERLRAVELGTLFDKIGG